MSEEFLRVAKQEVTDDILAIGNLLSECTDDNSIHKQASEIEKHIHKIKGLAPMMNQERIGRIAEMLDKLLKTVISGKTVPGLYQTAKKSCEFMRSEINGVQTDFEQIKAEIEKNHASFL
ncbi:MAG: Hpt domain-containing protein [Candidatus Nitrosotenuis sp.]